MMELMGDARPKSARPPYLNGFFLQMDRFRLRQGITYDLIHSHYWLSGRVGQKAGREWALPHLTTFHTLGAAKNSACGAQTEPQNRITAERDLAGEATRLLATSARERENLVRYCAAAPERIDVVPCGVDLDLFEGEFVVLLGPSGSGKSTLLNILGGLDSATSGEVHYAGHDLARASERELTEFRRDHVGFVFQFYNLIPSLTARENVAAVTEIARAPMTPEAALELVGMGERLDHFPAQLSGGEQQRVAIARAIAKNPAVLLCDEPTGALDSATGIVVLEAISRANRSLGTTTVVITHNVVIAGMADRVIRMADGRISGSERNAERKEARELAW